MSASGSISVDRIGQWSLRIYLHIVGELARFLGRSRDTATVEDLRR